MVIKDNEFFNPHDSIIIINYYNKKFNIFNFIKLLMDDI